jgi:gluconate 2-dehydrogenase gamma chain
MVGERPLDEPISLSRRNFLLFGAGVAAASVVEVPFIGTSTYEKGKQISSLQAQVDAAKQQIAQTPQLQGQLQQATSQAQALSTQLDTITGFLYLSADEQSLLEAIAETIIPSDSNGPGAKEAGVIYFIDRQLASDYGTCGTMYMQGPFIPTGTQMPITVDGLTYPHGTPVHGLTAGTRYQYNLDLRYFWRSSLEALQTYSNSAYHGDFQGLSSQQQTQVLADLWNNVPSSFNGIAPVDFAYELFFMVWSGFLTDPLYGGNVGMVGWEYVGFNGTNQGNFYGEGHAPLALAQQTTPTRLKPASLAQFQQQEPIL